MSRFSTIFERTLPAAYAAGGRTVTYNQQNADGVELTAIVADAVATEVEEGHQRYVEYRRHVTFRTDTTAEEGGIAAPASTDTIEIDGETWSVVSVENLSESEARVLAVRRMAAELAGRAFRKK